MLDSDLSGSVYLSRHSVLPANVLGSQGNFEKYCRVVTKTCHGDGSPFSLANGKSGDWWLNLAGDVGGVWVFVPDLFVLNEPSEPEAHFPPMYVRKVTLRYGTRERTRGIVAYNFQGSGPQSTQQLCATLRHCRLLETRSPPCPLPKMSDAHV